MTIFGADIWAWRHAGAYGSGTPRTPPKVGPTAISTLGASPKKPHEHGPHKIIIFVETKVLVDL